MRRLQRALDALTTPAPPEEVVRARAETLLLQVSDSPVAILIANNSARYVDVNRAALTFTGYSRDELLRMNVWDLTPAPRRSLGARLWRDFLRRGRMAGRYEVRRRDGTIIQANYVAAANALPGVHVSALTPVSARPHARPPRRPKTKRR